MFVKRFSSILPHVRDDSIISLPICNCDDEILFFYYTRSHDNQQFTLEKVLSVFSRDRKTGEIREIDLDHVLSREILENNSLISPAITGIDALRVRNEYLRLYEEFYDISEQLYSDSKADYDCTELLSAFKQLTPQSNLYEMYMELGKDYFALLKKHSR